MSTIPVRPLLNTLLRPLGVSAEPWVHPRRLETVVPLSVVIPAFNREELLPRALASVFAQSVKPSEVIVVDDASTDATREVAEASGARVIALERNSGASVARSVGVKAASHDWVGMLDSDDEWLPWTVETLWPVREPHDFVGGGAVWMRDGAVDHFEGVPFYGAVRLERPDALVWPQNMVPASGTIARRAALREAMEWGGDFRYSEDFAIWLRMLRRGSGLLVPRPTLRYHLHAGQKSLAEAKYHDQYAIVEEVYADRTGGERWLRRRQRFDDWERSRAGGQGRWAVLGQLRRQPGRRWVIPVLALRALQRRWTRRLTPELDLPVRGS